MRGEHTPQGIADQPAVSGTCFPVSRMWTLVLPSKLVRIRGCGRGRRQRREFSLFSKGLIQLPPKSVRVFTLHWAVSQAFEEDNRYVSVGMKCLPRGEQMPYSISDVFSLTISICANKQVGTEIHLNTGQPERGARL